MLTTPAVLQLILARIRAASDFSRSNFANTESQAPVVLTQDDCAAIVEALSALVDTPDQGTDGLTVGDYAHALAALPADTPIGRINAAGDFERCFELPGLCDDGLLLRD